MFFSSVKFFSSHIKNSFNISVLNISVGGHLFCGGNKLTSLAGAPTSGGFWCTNNTVKFTEQDVRAVCAVKKKVYV